MQTEVRLLMAKLIHTEVYFYKKKIEGNLKWSHNCLYILVQSPLKS